MWQEFAYEGEATDVGRTETLAIPETPEPPRSVQEDSKVTAPSTSPVKPVSK